MYCNLLEAVYNRISDDCRENGGQIICYSLYEATISDFVDHINKCYEGICLSVSELQSYTTRAVYRPELWLAVKDDLTGKIAATGIAELDREASILPIRRDYIASVASVARMYGIF